MPALFTSTSRRPSAVTVSATIRSASPAFETSPMVAIVRPPAPLISSANASASARLTSAIATPAASRAKARTMPSPIPCAPPVTSTTRPSNSAIRSQPPN
jgi:hypothetical protein